VTASPASPALPASDILTPEQLAANLKVTRAWVLDQLRARNRRARPLPYFRVGRFPRFSWVAVTAWLAASQHAAPAARHRR
jgi:hypothetical protein